MVMLNMSVVLFAITVFGLCHVEGFGMYRSMGSGNQLEHCPSSIDEIKTLLNLARIFEEQEKPKPNTYNPEDLILKLVNALVVTSTQNRASCDTTPSSTKTSGSSGSKGHRDSLVNLDILNPNNSNNVAQVDLGKQSVAGVGIGDTTNGVIGGALKDLA